MTKKFPTLQVLSAYSGIMLVDGSFADVHEIFDFLSPGIRTHEIRRSKVPEEILRQHPTVKELKFTEENYEEQSVKALKLFGHEMTLERK